MSEEKKEKVIEIKFDSSKEKIFILTKRKLTSSELNMFLELLTTMNKLNIFLLPDDFIESITVIKNVKEEPKKGEHGADP